MTGRMSRPSSERLILLVLAAIQFTHIMDFMVMMPLAPQLMRELSLGAGQFSALVAAYSIAAGGGGMLNAPVIDRVARRTLLPDPYAGCTVATAWCVLFRFIPPVRAHLQSGANKGRAFKELLRDGNAGRAIIFMAVMVLGHFSIIPLLSPHLVGDVALTERYLSVVYFIGGALSVV